MLVRWAYLLFVAVLCLIGGGAPSLAWAQSGGKPPHGVRRTAPATTASKPQSKVIRHRAIPEPDWSGTSGDTLFAGHIAPDYSTDYSAAGKRAPAWEPADLGDEYTASDDQPIYHDVAPSTWYASYPNPNEPLGFSGAMQQPAVPMDPRNVEGFFDDEYDPIVEPLDPDAPAPTVSSGEWLRDGFWYAQQSAVYMNRSVNVQNVTVLAIDIAAAILPHNNFFLQVPLDMGFEPGLRSMIGRHIGRDCRNRDHSLEFTFLGLAHWQTGGGLASVTSIGLFTPIDPTPNNVPVYNGSTEQTFDQVSDFNSFEWNYRIDRRLSRDQMIYTRDSTWVRQATPALLPSLYAGIRYVSVNENLFWLAETEGPTQHGSYQVTTHNNMVGPQCGLDVFYERTDWRVGVRTRAAATVNWGSQQSTVRIFDANGPLVPDRDEFVDSNDAAFVGELGFVGAYHFRPNFALRFSYDMMWVTNLALAQNQLTFNPALPAEISNSHSLFYQSLTFGIDIVR